MKINTEFLKRPLDQPYPYLYVDKIDLRGAPTSGYSNHQLPVGLKGIIENLVVSNTYDLQLEIKIDKNAINHNVFNDRIPENIFCARGSGLTFNYVELAFPLEFREDFIISYSVSGNVPRTGEIYIVTKCRFFREFNLQAAK